MAVGLALVCALAYGAADFFGGMASRRMPASAVTLLSQVAGLVVLALAYPLVPGRFYLADRWGLGAGIFGALGIGALYAALAVGRMGVVSPVTAVVGASVPVVWGLWSGERPAGAALAGVGLAFVAVALVSTSPDTRRLSAREPGVAAALLSGLAIGFLYVFLSHTHRDGGLTVLAAARAGSLAALGLYAVAMREAVRPPPALVPTIAAAGGLDMVANILYVVATRFGLLTIVAVLTSLYPASTVFLARIVLGERLSLLQWAGVACAAGGVVLIAI